MIDPLTRHSNVYTDTSGVRRFDLLQQAVQRAGAHKVLFGSDGPWLHPGVELAKVRALGLQSCEEKLILGQTFLHLIKDAPKAEQDSTYHPCLLRRSWLTSSRS